MSDSEIILQVENFTKKFPVSGGKFLTACDNINFSVRKGETLAVVGESGCGKSTLLKSIMNMQKPTAGKIIFHDMRKSVKIIAIFKWFFKTRQPPLIQKCALKILFANRF